MRLKKSCENNRDEAHLKTDRIRVRRYRIHLPDPLIRPGHIFSFNTLSGITVIEPTGFLEFLHLESNARLILTDSGGVLEESCIPGVPCVTLRNTTERPETIDVGSNVLVGTRPEQIREGVREQLNQQRHWENPYGDGSARVRIVHSISGTNEN